uniref:PDZ domain-containing protein n=1 Tax=Heterorhabditis bacteriophora TaxID=37862 RepID=A0A1I7X8R9_HETBA
MSLMKTAVLLSTNGKKHQNGNCLVPECSAKTKHAVSDYKDLIQKGSLSKIRGCTSKSKEALYPSPSSVKLGNAHIVESYSEIPKSHVKLVYVTIHLDGEKKLDLVMSSNLVVRSINKYSTAFHQLIVGDQILKINDIVPMSINDIQTILQSELPTIRLSVVRPWNIRSASERRMESVKKQDCCSYLVIIVHKIKNLRNGFEVKLVNKQCHVVKVSYTVISMQNSKRLNQQYYCTGVDYVDNNTRGSYAFLKGDRLLDVDRIPLTGNIDLHFVRRQFNKVMANKKRCTFLIERPLSLRSSPNPSCFASKTGLELEMGDDATEIGCREAMRHSLLKDKYRIISILRDVGTNMKMTVDPTVIVEDDDVQRRQRNKKKSHGNIPIKRISIEVRLSTLLNRNYCIYLQLLPFTYLLRFIMGFQSKNEILPVPSDVKDENQLQKVIFTILLRYNCLIKAKSSFLQVTAKSGLVQFFRPVVFGHDDIFLNCHGNVAYKCECLLYCARKILIISVHRIEFEHGTTTGKRVIRVDGKFYTTTFYLDVLFKQELLRRDWMFKLVGKEAFQVGDMKCIITVEALGTFAYEYSLEVNGKNFEKFREEQNKKLQSWELLVGGEDTRVVLDKESVEVWVNGQKIDTAGEFVEDGTETHFEIGRHVCKITATSSGKKKTGVVHELYVDGQHVPHLPMTKTRKNEISPALNDGNDGSSGSVATPRGCYGSLTEAVPISDDMRAQSSSVSAIHIRGPRTGISLDRNNNVQLDRQPRVIHNTSKHVNEGFFGASENIRYMDSRSCIEKQYEIGPVIGKGNFSRVHFALRRKDNKKCALKAINKQQLRGKWFFIENEVEIMLISFHPNICRLMDAFKTSTKYFLVFEFAQNGDLFDLIRREGRLSEAYAATITSQVASALAYLHTRRIVHRDVKPENLLLHEGRHVRLCDFGLACTVLGPLFRVCGTPTYCAPEILKECGYGVAVDVWSLGVLLHVMLVGYAPFRSNERNILFRLIIQGKLFFDLPVWSSVSSSKLYNTLRTICILVIYRRRLMKYNLSSGGRDLVSRMVNPIVDKRPTADELSSHPWISKFQRND